ncbi:putative Indoleamine 2,3-dioxygenase 1 [Cardiosporidium cionae]|uniref:Indoleamine 2,3-dioxygenase 1 n=1 Tax=Cardiosporidium cionae TaxID=476202 RepID=A0ABQ7J443_9APIC|nr:putative Indoleamine 2,3-dioxygenase 1 [Cardiosporidium cionae]|eukprot:KAF8817796.1 putative Indoleamine 2,3-dioxygenase 1 [Cardiosporidium cionae]
MLESLVTFTGSRSEEIFYLVVTQIEHIGSRLTNECFNLSEYVANPSAEKRGEQLKKFLQLMYKTIEECNATFPLLHSGCIPEEFFNNQRSFLRGFGRSKPFPEGLIFEGVEPTAKRLDIMGKAFYISTKDTSNHNLLRMLENCSKSSSLKIIANGATAGQSSFIHLLDIILGVDLKNSSISHFKERMRCYMPKGHRTFLDDVKPVCIALREIIKTDHSNILPLFNSCVEALTAFRRFHIGVVQRYIIQPQKLRENFLSYNKPTEGVDSDTQEKLEGTSGTDILPFLKFSCDRTVEAKLNSN